MAVRLDDLCINGYKIYQDDCGFRFGTDAVLLAWFAGNKKFAKAADLCAGNGVISVILSTHNCCKEARGYEIDEGPFNLSKMTAEYNKITDKVSFYLRDIRNTETDGTFPSAYFDLVTANPPYMTENSGLVSEARGTARTELTCTVNDVVNAANVLLKNGGRFCMINKPDRLTDAMCIMREKKIEPKRLMFVSARNGKKPELFLIEGIKQGKPGLYCEPTLEIYGSDGAYTETLNKIYGRI
ncbi:MAG: methyltransferase [Clostridia bacterium]|nr:methyltransferase [Clostridia bacterium]MBQ2719983.1 methyltransferase [Clostridia bacterium]